MKMKWLIAAVALITGAVFSYHFFSAYVSTQTIPQQAEQDDTVLVKNWKETPQGKMRNFRVPASLKKKKLKKPLYHGLKCFAASGSAQVFYDHMQELKELLPDKQVIIVDLRQESHGFINGLPVSWYNKFNDANKHKSLAEIEQDEIRRLNDIMQKKQVSIYTLVKTGKHQPKTGGDPLTVEVKDALTERELARKAGVGYERFPIQDWNAPSDEQVDRFVNFVKSLPENAWLHFHCKAGRGRTTIFMTMYDIMRNAPKVDFETIVKRQKKLGGINFFDDGFSNRIKYRGSLARMSFIRLFYTYVKDASPDNFKQSWTAWLKEHLS